MSSNEQEILFSEEKSNIDIKSLSTLTESCAVSNDLKEEESAIPITNCIAEDNESKKVDSTSQLSKSQLKKLAKKRKWEESKILRRAKTKAKKKELKEQIKKGLAHPESLPPRKVRKSNLMKDSSCKVAIAIDMSFNHLMIEKDLAKCIKQINRCYSINRKQKEPIQYYVTSFGGEAENIMNKHNGWKHWDVNFTNKSYMEVDKYPKEKIVYLTSESDNVLSELHDDYLYVIGGLVDHNSQKGLCHLLAVKNQINHARLPIEEHIDMKSRKVLTIDHVFEILVQVAQKTPWDNALMNVIAPRKQAQLKTGDTS